MAANNTTYQQEPLYNEIAKLAPLSVAIVITNTLVVVLFFKKRYLQTIPNYPLLSLAACDFITGFVVIPLFILSMYILTRESSSKETKTYLSYMVLVLHALTSTSAVYHILVVIADKYFAIVWPRKHRSLEKKTMLKVLAVVWLVSSIISCIPISWINVSQKPIARKLFVGYGIFCLVIVFISSYVCIVYALVVMFRVISGKNKHKESALLRRRNTSRNRQMTNNIYRVCIIFAMMAAVFAVCWLPWFMLTLLVNLQVHVENLHSFMEWFVPFRYLTSIINPLLYTFVKPDFRRAFKELVWNRIVRTKHPFGSQSNMTRPTTSFLFKTFKSSTNTVDVPALKRGTGIEMIENPCFVSSV
ncbi:hypothetical protein OS493_023938 [Desmophyllum pertusum]|uniref:G-protein coupled receptors family 1 profile domain-containing protein n=1 Tax=Desmophyllum pertusum TaxID=174260 RepID=A0A9W9YAE4_9CNID|nr:hypothetical protein OS493_023938 [Desmophyllum pertusum]